MLRFGGLGRGPGSSDVVVSALRYVFNLCWFVKGVGFRSYCVVLPPNHPSAKRGILTPNQAEEKMAKHN